MRSRLPLSALILFVLGLELSTSVFSYVYWRYREGIETFLNPNLVPDYVGMVGGTLFMLVGGTGLVISTWAVLAIEDVGPGGLCPRCGASTGRIRRRLSHRVLSFLTGRVVSRRSCTRCSWKGLIYKN